MWPGCRRLEWLDEEIPALDGEPPRRAVRTAAGKAKVLEMVKDIEHSVADDRSPTQEPR